MFHNQKDAEKIFLADDDDVRGDIIDDEILDALCNGRTDKFDDDKDSEDDENY